MKNLAIRAETIRTLGVESAPRPCPTTSGPTTSMPGRKRAECVTTSITGAKL